MRYGALGAAVFITVVALGARVVLDGGSPSARTTELSAGFGATPQGPAGVPTASGVGTIPLASPAPTLPEPTETTVDTPIAITTVPESGSGRFATASGESRRFGSGETLTYSVEVEGGLDIDAQALARTVDRVLGDRRGCTAVEAQSLQRVDADPAVHIRLATPTTTDRLCAPLDTGGRLSCRNGDMVVLNAWRWVKGADAYEGNLAGYRRYMINHEFGHALGNGHRECPSARAVAPVMVQQTKGLQGCTANPWPAVTDG